MHDCRAAEVCIFHTVGKVFVLLFGDGLERLVSVPGPGSYVSFSVEGATVRPGATPSCPGAV